MLAGIESFGRTSSQGSEDSAHAIRLLLIASHGSATIPDLSDFMCWYQERMEITSHTRRTDGKSDPKALNPYAIEFFSCAILNRLGVRTAPARICTKGEARTLGPEFIVKVMTNPCATAPYSGVPGAVDVMDAVCAGVFGVDVRVLKFARARAMLGAGHALVVEVIPDSASMDFIARKLLPQSNARNQLQTVMSECGSRLALGKMPFDEFFAQALGKSCLPADELFSRFRPSSEELRTIESAISVTGEKYLRILAARVLLGISAGHFGNVLCTRGGELVSIDHVSGRIERGDDLETLFRFVNRDSLVFQILCEIANLTEDDIRGAVAAISSHPVCGSTDGIVDYFDERLKLFRELCSTAQPEDIPVAVGAS
jgi:hypothetical protein